MEEYEKERIESCISSIQDNLEAIRKEIKLERPYKYYILDKLEPIFYDVKCIKSICESEEK